MVLPDIAFDSLQAVAVRREPARLQAEGAIARVVEFCREQGASTASATAFGTV